MRAINAGDAAKISHAVKAGAKLNAQRPDGSLPLAAANGKLDTLQLLLGKDADINRVTPKGFTPLFFAMSRGNPQAPMMLLDAGADASYVAPDGTSAVQMAIYQKQFSVADALIKRGVDLNAYDRNGNQLLHAAVRNKQLQLVETLLVQGANPNTLAGTSSAVWRYEVNFTSRPYVTYPKSPLLLAAVSSNAETLSLALSFAPDINIANKSGKTALHVLLGYSFYMPLTIEQIAAMFDVLSRQGAKSILLTAAEQRRWISPSVKILKPKQNFPGPSIYNQR
jgi:ankyrin repeat protein